MLEMYHGWIHLSDMVAMLQSVTLLETDLLWNRMNFENCNPFPSRDIFIKFYQTSILYTKT